MFDKTKHSPKDAYEDQVDESLKEILGHTIAIEAIDDLRNILIEGIQKRPLLKRVLEMTSVRVKALGRVPEDLDKDGNFFTACDIGEYEEVLLFLLYFITGGRWGEEIKLEGEPDSLDWLPDPTIPDMLIPNDPLHALSAGYENLVGYEGK